MKAVVQEHREHEEGTKELVTSAETLAKEARDKVAACMADAARESRQSELEDLPTDGPPAAH